MPHRTTPTPPTLPCGFLRWVGAVLAGLLVMVLGAGTAGAAEGARGRVAVVGVPGLEWSDLDQARTPNLWKLVGQGGAASLSTRAVPPPDRGITCPTAGWLTVSAGQRAGTAGRGCPRPPTPRTEGEGASVPGWSDLVKYQASTGYGAELGTLGQLVQDSGGKVVAIGPGAALGAADKTGKVAKYSDSTRSAGDLTPYNLVVFEAGALSDAWLRQPLDEFGVPLPLSASARQAAVAEADSSIGALLGKLPADTTVLVAGVSDVTPNAHLHVAIATGPSPSGAPYRRGLLTATSTRQDGLVTITDLTATAIHLLGLPEPRAVVGRTWDNDGVAPATVTDTVTQLADSDLASQVLRDVRGPFFAVFVTVQLLFYAFAALALRRRRSASTPANPAEDSAADIHGSGQNARTASATGQPGPGSDATTRRAENSGVAKHGALPAGSGQNGTGVTGRIGPGLDHHEQASTSKAAGRNGHATSASANGMGASGASPGREAEPGHDPSGTGPGDAATSRLLVAVQLVSVVSGAIAVSTFLAQLVPWWSLGAPMVALIGTILGIAVLITALAFAGPWRTHVLGPLTVVAGISSVALLIDVMTGSTLQVNAVTGYEPVTGGRFYGFSNIAFAVYSTGTILALAGVAQWLRERGLPRTLVVLLCAAYGGLAVFADGWPSWGADFGGVPAFVVGVAVLLILLSGRRVSVVKLLLVAVAGAALISAIAVFDWLRPEEQRTHLGTFVQQVIDGQAWTVVWRKFSAMVGVTVGNWSLTLLTVVALAFLFFVLDRPSRWGASALGQAYRLAPALRAGLFGALTCAFIGFLSNDSGIAIPAMALTVAVPLTLAACVRALQLAKPTTPARSSAPAAPTAPSGTEPRS